MRIFCPATLAVLLGWCCSVWSVCALLLARMPGGRVSRIRRLGRRYRSETCSPLFFCPGPPVHAVGRVAPTAHTSGAGMLERPRSQGAHGSVRAIGLAGGCLFRSPVVNLSDLQCSPAAKNSHPARATCRVCLTGPSDFKSSGSHGRVARPVEPSPVELRPCTRPPLVVSAHRLSSRPTQRTTPREWDVAHSAVRRSSVACAGMAESALRLSTPPELSTFLLGDWRPVTPSGTLSSWDKQKRPLVMT